MSESVEMCVRQRERRERVGEREKKETNKHRSSSFSTLADRQ